MKPMMGLLLFLTCALGADLSAQDNDLATLGDGGLHFRTDDDAFELQLFTATQFRLTWHDTRAQGSQSGQGQNGADFINFSLPAVRSFIHGHIFAPEFQYSLWLVFNWPNQPAIRLEDAFFRWAPTPLFNLTVGQMRVPATWAYQVDHEKMVMADRDIADEAFNQGWGKGIEVSGRATLYGNDDDPALLRWNVGLFNGALASPNGNQGRGALITSGGASQGVSVTDMAGTNHYNGGFRNSDWKVNPETFGQLVDQEMMIAARIEFHPMGEVRRHVADMENNEDSAVWKVMIGMAASYFTARVSGVGTFLGNVYHGDTNPGTPTTGSGRLPVEADIFHATMDGHFRWLGLAVNWALHLRTVKFTAHGSLRNLNLDEERYAVQGTTDVGASVDVNYFVLRDQLNIAARFAWVNFDEFRSRQLGTGTRVDSDAFGADGWEYGGGATWFIHGDNLKLNLDYRYVVQQLPHGAGHGKAALDGIERSSDYLTFQEIRLQLQWIF